MRVFKPASMAEIVYHIATNYPKSFKSYTIEAIEYIINDAKEDVFLDEVLDVFKKYTFHKYRLDQSNTIKALKEYLQNSKTIREFVELSDGSLLVKH